MSGWSELWHQFVVTLTQQPVAVVLAVWTGLALVLVMALEGLILNLFPVCVFRRYLEKMPERKAKSRSNSAPPPAPVALPVSRAPVMEMAASAPVALPAPMAVLPVAAETPAKRRPSRNPKKPDPGPKTIRAATIPRRAPPQRERLSRSTPRLLKTPAA